MQTQERNVPINGVVKPNGNPITCLKPATKYYSKIYLASFRTCE